MDAKKLPVRPSLEQYNKQAKDLLKRCHLAEPEALNRIRRNHPRLGKLSQTDFLSVPLALADAQLAVAREHGFASWPKFVEHIEEFTRESSPVSRFESAADAVIGGDAGTLERLLRDDPELVRARSLRSHRATLLHYVAANGVEDFRQKTPKNAVRVAETLLTCGAEVDALAETYGGGAGQTTLNLLVSSCHPAKAGAQVALVDTLVDYGAAINGLEDNASPLMTALAFHYAEAAEALVRRGARVDTLIAAAALGREDLVEKFMGEAGVQNADGPRALVWAAMHRRMRVVELLLREGVDPGARDHRRWTALHWAAFYGYAEIVELLLRWNAPLEVQNEFGGTPLNQTVWATVHERLLPDHLSIIQMLLNAGAKVEPGWFEPDLSLPLDPRVAALLRTQLS